MAKEKILVAMSGGVDSSVVAAKLINDGYEVEGITLKFGNFCGDLAIIDAKKIAKKLNIKHNILDVGEKFENKIIKYFVDEYSKGKTPNPCVKCNREIKFYELLKFREKIGATHLATGHYAKITKNGENYYLEKGKDIIKDQSYFLGQLKYEYLQYLKFPLENMEKSEVREYAKNLQLHIADKEESQDICFTKGEDYKKIIENYYKIKKGDIIHIENGEKLGEHSGIIYYTQGQRKGLGIGWTEPLFVIRIDPEKNIVYVGNEKNLFKNNLLIENINYLDLSLEFEKEYEFDVKLRSVNNIDKAKIIFHSDYTANINLLKPSRNISIGQLCCIYDNSKVIASGYI